MLQTLRHQSDTLVIQDLWDQLPAQGRLYLLVEELANSHSQESCCREREANQHNMLLNHIRLSIRQRLTCQRLQQLRHRSIIIPSSCSSALVKLFGSASLSVFKSSNSIFDWDPPPLSVSL